MHQKRKSFVSIISFLKTRHIFLGTPLRLLLFFPFIFSCKEKSKETQPSPISLSSGNMVLVCNEGNFRWGNASLGLMNLETNQWDEDVFKSFNGNALGDVCQSATLWGQDWWIVVNNSAKIEILNGADLKSVKTLNGFVSPRYLMPVSNTKGYVTDLYAEKIWIVDGPAKEIKGSIPFPGWGEEMAFSNQILWVVNRKKNILYGINPNTDKISDSIVFPGKLTSLCKSSGNRIWVGFEAGRGTGPGMALVNAETKTIEKTWTSSATAYPFNLQNSTSGDTVFFIQEKPKMLSLTDTEWPVADLLDGKTGNFYGLGFDLKRKEIWASDAKDYQQKSKLIRKNLADGSIREYPGGIISSRFYFW